MDLPVILLFLLIAILFAVSLLFPLLFLGGGIAALAWGLTKGLSGKERRFSPSPGFRLRSPDFRFPQPKPTYRVWLARVWLLIATAVILWIVLELWRRLAEILPGPAWLAWPTAALGLVAGALLLAVGIAVLFPVGRSFLTELWRHIVLRRLLRGRETGEADFKAADEVVRAPGTVSRAEGLALWSEAEDLDFARLASMDQAARQTVETRLGCARHGPPPLRVIAFADRGALARNFKCDPAKLNAAPVWFSKKGDREDFFLHREWPVLADFLLFSLLLRRHLPLSKRPFPVLEYGLTNHLRPGAAAITTPTDPQGLERRLRAARQRDGRPPTLADLQSALLSKLPNCPPDVAAWEKQGVAGAVANVLAGWLLRQSPDFRRRIGEKRPGAGFFPDKTFRDLFQLEPQSALREALAEFEARQILDSAPVEQTIRDGWRASLLPRIRNRAADPAGAMAAMEEIRFHGHPLAGAPLIEILNTPGDPFYWHALVTLENLFGETGGRSAHHWQARMDRIGGGGQTTPPPLPRQMKKPPGEAAEKKFAINLGDAGETGRA